MKWNQEYPVLWGLVSGCQGEVVTLLQPARRDRPWLQEQRQQRKPPFIRSAKSGLPCRSLGSHCGSYTPVSTAQNPYPVLWAWRCQSCFRAQTPTAPGSSLGIHSSSIRVTEGPLMLDAALLFSVVCRLLLRFKAKLCYSLSKQGHLTSVPASHL